MSRFINNRKVNKWVYTVGVLLLLFSIPTRIQAQTNIRLTNPKVESILMGNFSPTDYSASSEADVKNTLCEIQKSIVPDSFLSYLEKMETFHTRHTYSDTVSETTGIGAARRWAYKKFEEFSTQNQDRLIPSYLEFDYLNGSCGNGYDWKNILAVLPGTDVTDHKIILVEAHIDSRCEDPCDTLCYAAGMEDNGSGTALVLELARVMSQFRYRHSIVFMLTIGEEQGLYGADAMATFCEDKGIQIKAVLNNDVIGGITCGKTSSPPSCEEEGDVDSTRVRIFSNGGLTLPHRNLARTIAWYYSEAIRPNAKVTMEVDIMNQEDRTGRGGDHIPFGRKGFPSIRFTAANEHGNAHPDDEYEDRQHSVRDVLGEDVNGDGVLDKYYVDFNYLKRNTVINGISAALLAAGPETPEFTLHDEPAGLRVEITSGYSDSYRISVRKITLNQGLDKVYRTSQKSYSLPGLEAGTAYRVSVAGISSDELMSPFSGEILKINDANTAEGEQDKPMKLVDCNSSSIDEPFVQNDFELKIIPNPSQGQFFVVMRSSETPISSSLIITDITGRLVQDQPVLSKSWNSGEIQIPINIKSGVYYCSWKVNGKNLSKMVVVQ